MVMLFSSLDSSGDGQLQIEEFVSGIEQLPILRNLEVEGRTLNHDDFMQVARSIDRSGNGTINYLEFLQAFESTGTSDIMDTLGEDISTVLFRPGLLSEWDAITSMRKELDWFERKTSNKC